ncbi:MAG: nuclear transport factor 2 family protein [Caulobacter sp.]|nr:nuclear transport factor 2 family protein [Caulobacter sp.]
MLTLDQRKDAVRALLLTAFDPARSIDDKRQAMSRLMDAQGYVQHSPGLENGLESLLELIDGFDRDFPGYAIEVVRVIGEGDLVFAHCHYTYGPADPRGKAIAEIFRFEGDRIVEHWDVIQDVPASSRNSNGMF